jgi:hypothetical protein
LRRLTHYPHPLTSPRRGETRPRAASGHNQQPTNGAARATRRTMKAIQTKYHGPTNAKGSRISAKAEGIGRIYIPYPHELSGVDCHRKAAWTLMDKLGWNKSYNLVSGALPDGTYAHCLVGIVYGEEAAR